MKKSGSLLSLFTVALGLGAAGSLPAQSPGQTATNLVAQGRAMLVTSNLASAYASFNQAVGLLPNYLEANALAGATRILTLPQQPAGSSFLNRLGFSTAGRNIYDWEAKLPHDADGKTMLPANFNSSEAIAFYTTNVMPAILASQTNLARITDTNFTLNLSAAETSIEAVTVDYGDIQVLRALLYVGDFLGHTANAHNFSIVYSHLQALSEAQPSQLTIQRVLADYSSLLKQGNHSDLLASKTAFTNAAACYLAASDFIRNDRPAGATRLFDLAPDKQAEEATFRDDLTNALASLTKPVLVNTNSPVEVYLGAYFSGGTPLRSLLPQFVGSRYVDNSLPDYTFGGLLLNEPAWKTEAALRKKWAPSYAGIYVGQPGYYDNMGNFVPSGGFALFVDNNQQAVLLGADTDNASALFAACPVDKSGNAWFDTNGFSGSLEIYSDGSLYGNVQPDNGNWWDGLQGNLVPEIGPFQAVDGYYAGTWSEGGKTGKIQGILAADGGFYSCPTDSDGEIADGGWGAFSSNGSLGTMTDAQGRMASTGTLSPTTATMSGTGTSTNGSHGTWTMRRTDFAQTDVPPAITTPPLNQTVYQGQGATFHVAATGSKPLCYQWSCNGALILGATSSALALTNLPLAADGATYAVEVHNVVGAADASAVLHVHPSEPLTLQVNGQGKVTPNLNGQLLPVGSTTNITAQGTNGFQFTNWTSNLQGLLTNGPNLSFIMETGLVLTAKFVDVTKPTLKIISPANGVTVTAPALTLSGTTADNDAVTNVLWQLNTNAWKSAKGTANWSAAVTLTTLGANTLRAYAVDRSGNHSATTNSVALTYKPYVPLALRLVGQGKLTPSYTNGQMLQIGVGYTLTATASTGFKFWGWTGSQTNHSATLSFTMASNLVIVANFVDIKPPLDVIIYPTKGQVVATNNPTVLGAASDNVGVTNVWCWLNGTNWLLPQTTNFWTNWFAAGVLLAPGTNVLQTYAEDAAGNPSLTNTIRFDHPAGP